MRLQRHITDIYDFSILNEVRIDFTDTSYFKYIKRYNGYVWDLLGTEMIFRGYHSSNNEWFIKFGVHKGNGDIEIEMTNNNDIKRTIRTLEDIPKALVLFTRKYKPNQITFTADRPSRQKIYERIILLMYKRKELMMYSLPDKEISDTDGSITYIIRKK